MRLERSVSAMDVPQRLDELHLRAPWEGKALMGGADKITNAVGGGWVDGLVTFSKGYPIIPVCKAVFCGKVRNGRT
ncbi:MAG: hypothetical protein WKF37_22285 [Bryobacteraceae bacterium]